MRPVDRERGAALLSVLLLVAVMATVAATALDRLGVATRLAANAATLAQARSWLSTAELLATTRIEDLLAADASQTTLAGGWLGIERSVALPDGATVRARVEDGGNCFNLNSLVDRRDTRLVARSAGETQFMSLMTLLGFSQGEAARLAAGATTYILGDPSTGSAAFERPAAMLMADKSELRAVPGVTARQYGLLERWICTLPTTDLAPINVNTLLPEQAPLLAMLVPGQIDLARARAQLAMRPTGGYGSVVAFWNSPALQGVQPPSEAAEQAKVRTSFFTLHATVQAGSAELSEMALIDARTTPVRLIARRWGEPS